MHSVGPAAQAVDESNHSRIRDGCDECGDESGCAEDVDVAVEEVPWTWVHLVSQT